jgi:mannose-6-phosphate isomerase-like protein (cupin superfamily)
MNVFFETLLMSSFRLLLVIAALLLSTALAADQPNAAEILARYAEAWRGQQEMPLESTVVLAVSVSGPGGGDFAVTLPPEGPGQLDAGAPADFTFGYETDIEFLRRLDRGEISALTALGQARADDATPMRLTVPEGFHWTAASRDLLLPLTFHFWNREWPERIAFGEAHARLIHGANAVVFYYQGGLRTAWYQIRPGMHVNPDPRDQANPFKSLLVITRGAIAARLDGRETLLREGEAVLIPPGMTHEFWADGDQSGEAVLVMFAEGA